MVEMALVICIGLIGGLAVGTQAPIAGAMAQRVGGASSSFIVHIGGTIVSGALLIARGGENIHEWRNLPWYMLGVGVFGLVLYLSLSYTIPRVGATTAIALIIVGQLVAGMVIDHFGAFGISQRPIEFSHIVGLVLLLGGAFLIIR